MNQIYQFASDSAAISPDGARAKLAWSNQSSIHSWICIL